MMMGGKKAEVREKKKGEGILAALDFKRSSSFFCGPVTHSLISICLAERTKEPAGGGGGGGI